MDNEELCKCECECDKSELKGTDIRNVCDSVVSHPVDDAADGMRRVINELWDIYNGISDVATRLAVLDMISGCENSVLENYPM